MQIFKNTNIDFVGKRKIFLVFSAVFLVLGIIGVAICGVDYGIDFEGGTEMITEFATPINTERVRDAVTDIGLEGAEIKSFGAPNQYIIRIKNSTTPTDQIADAINKAIPEVDMKLLKVDNIGPKIGNELRTQAIIALLVALVALMIYIAFRFEFKFGIGAVIAITHDVLISFCVAIIINRLGIATIEINQTFLAAILTVIGYSINDTVIIFDRIRENMEIMKGKDIATIANVSLNETLNRTIITVLTVLLVLVTLIIWGGPVLLSFAILMTLGTIFGTYSSIYIASNVVIMMEHHKQKKANISKA
jgi:preprotein translocase subunit SecF